MQRRQLLTLGGTALAASVAGCRGGTGVDDFVETREAMNGTDLTEGGVGQRTNNGILQYLRVERRGNFLVPPRRHRSLPRPDPA